MIKHDIFQQDILRTAPSDEGENQAARVTVASRSRDASDCAVLLEMLGLTREPPAPEPDGGGIHLLPPLLDGTRRPSRWL
ncbi:hypothetical protein [Streptomyces sp. NPDC089919]|uniref:hypothetical protein n=1 Tax=Streptomyces sp. NPDC089919 TaxID=3155188 RepID=UPI00341ED48F